MEWIEALAYAKLKSLGRYVLLTPERELVLFDTPEGVFAIDNACPHRGFPMADARLDIETCQVSCIFHTWDFDLKDGRCLNADSNIAVFETEVRGKKVWVKC